MSEGGFLGPLDEHQDDIPADLMRAAELAAYEALKEDHREPPALWAALVHRAVVGVLPLHEQQVRSMVAAELKRQAYLAAVADVDGTECVEARTWSAAAEVARAAVVIQEAL